MTEWGVARKTVRGENATTIKKAAVNLVAQGRGSDSRPQTQPLRLG
jgi:hypothetical protein